MKGLIVSIISFLHARTKAVAILLALVGLLGFFRLAIAQDPVNFPDANLKAAVEGELGISDPTPTDMLSLTYLNAHSSEIVDLTGIEYATNLTHLLLYGNQISDISVLSGLMNLTRLILSDNQISDISALSTLTNLTELRLDRNPLNLDAYCTYLPLIEGNNTGIDLYYDPSPYSDCDCEVSLIIEKVNTAAGNENTSVDVILDNPNDEVRGIQVDICEGSNNLLSTNAGINPPPSDCLVCTGCEVTERTSDFNCSTNELENRCCRVVLVAQDEFHLIDAGTGPVFTVKYNTSVDCLGEECKTLNPENVKIADELDNPFDVCTTSGEVCLSVSICGDIYPDAMNCGNGEVDIFDVLEAIDITLDIGVHSDCQFSKADVPTGTPPNCLEPDGVIDIFDIIVIIDVALERDPNCCGDVVFTPADAKTQGYWHHQCMALGLIGKNKGKPKLHEEWMADLPNIEEICDNLDADPKDMCSKATKQLQALMLNLMSGSLSESICIEPEGTIGDAIEIIEDLINNRRMCKEANDLADGINTGNILIECP